MHKPENVLLVGETVFKEMSQLQFGRHYTITITFLSVVFFIKTAHGAENHNG